VSTEARAYDLEAGVLLADVLHSIDSLLGLRYQPHQWSDLLRLLKPAARELGFNDSSTFLTQLVRGTLDERMIHVLAKHLTIGESYFFREIVVFSILRERLLPALLERKEAQGDRHLRIWSAGCSTGEEVYTIAILLDSLLRDRADWKYSVLGTDVNPVAIERAREGVYRDWSFRDFPSETHAEYFGGTEDGRHAVVQRVRDNTEFRILNLVSAPALYPAGFDLIFCRNVMMYFTREKVKCVVQGFRRSLKEEGWLIPSLTETTLINNPGFEGVRFGEATLFRKQPHMAKIFKFVREAAPPAEYSSEESVPPARGLRNPFAGLFSNGEQALRATDASAAAPPDAPRPRNAEDLAAIPVAASSEAGDGVNGGESANGEIEQLHEMIREARRHADAGRLEQALSITRAALAHNKMDPHAHFMHGTILRECGETTQAMLAFERALYLNQDFIPAHFSIGALSHHMGNMPKARRHFGIAVQLIEALGATDIVLEPGTISAQRMMEIIRTFIDR
jgi:chemotaxis protein methyltransferase CheR